jgi:D-proline reductase (dithiol) PrdB
MDVDSFRYLPSLIKRYYLLNRVNKELPIPFAPLVKPLDQCRFGLVTSGGLFHTRCEPGFDQDGERKNPAWGDPSFRTLPVDMNLSEVGVSHLHINHRDVLADPNILLPVQRFHELAAEGRVRDLAPHAYSFMGYQGFPSDLNGWKDTYGPAVRDRLLAERVDCVLLTTA